MYYVDDTHMKQAGPKSKTDQNVFLTEINNKESGECDQHYAIH